MGLFRFLHRWPAIIPAGSPLADIIPFLDDRDRELEDHLNYRSVAHVPTLTNITLNDGTSEASYVQQGRQITYRGEIVLGSTSTVGGNITIDLPVPARSSIPYLGTAIAADASGAYARNVGVAEIDTDVWGQAVNLSSTGVASWTTTVPITWANGDVIHWNITYESAE